MTTGSLRSSGTQGAGGSGIGPGGRASNPFGSFISSSGGSFSLSAVMPGLPRASSRQAPSSATNQPGQDLLDLGDFAPPTPGDTSGPYVGNTFSTSSRGSRKASFGSRTPVSAVETPSPSVRFAGKRRSGVGAFRVLLSAPSYRGGAAGGAAPLLTIQPKIVDGEVLRGSFAGGVAEGLDDAFGMRNQSRGRESWSCSLARLILNLIGRVLRSRGDAYTELHGFLLLPVSAAFPSVNV